MGLHVRYTSLLISLSCVKALLGCAINCDLSQKCEDNNTKEVQFPSIVKGMLISNFMAKQKRLDFPSVSLL